MNTTNCAVWLATALVLITSIIAKVARRRTTFDPVKRNRPSPPPAVSCVAFIGLLNTFFTKGLQAMVLEQYNKLGSVVTVSFFGKKLTFLIGPEVSVHFYQGLDSEVSLNMFEFTVPILGKDVGYSVDAATRNEQLRFYSDALKPSTLRRHMSHMLQEVEDYFGKWGLQGTVDLGQQLGQLIMLITGRCLLGKEVRDKMLDEFFTLYHEMVDNGTHVTSMLFPYAPTLMNYRRDRAHARLSEMLAEIVRSRKSSNRVEEDVLQNLIDSKYGDGRPTTESEITGLMIALLMAAKQSCSATVTWTGLRLLSHPICTAVAMEEQKEIVRKYGNCIDYNALIEMDYLHFCIKETLRMHPPTPALLRKVHKDFTLKTSEGNEYEIPREHTIVSPILFNSSIPCIYKDPEVFDPDRFGPAREEDKIGGKFSYLGFGGGRHACLGQAYAYTQIKVIWSHLLRNFELKLVSPFPETDWSKVVPEPKGKVMVSYKRQGLHNT